MKNIIQLVKTLMPHEVFDALGVGIFDFKKNSFEVIEANHFEDEVNGINASFLQLQIIKNHQSGKVSHFI